jgi:hypothetical protein
MDLCFRNSVLPFVMTVNMVVFLDVILELINLPGTSETVQRFLEKLLPLLFGEQSAGKSGKRAAYALVQGVLCPPDAEMGWLGACLAGADGWVNICIGVSRD